MENLINRKKPVTDEKISKFVENRIGMDFNYMWYPVEREFRRYYRNDFVLSKNTIILFFSKSRISVRLGISDFEGIEPMFPPSLLENALQIKYRCSITHKILNGSKFIETILPIESFQIPDGTVNYKSLLDVLRNE
jgi:hypothetical protein